MKSRRRSFNRENAYGTTFARTAGLIMPDDGENWEKERAARSSTASDRTSWIDGGVGAVCVLLVAAALFLSFAVPSSLFFFFQFVGALYFIPVAISRVSRLIRGRLYRVSASAAV